MNGTERELIDLQILAEHTELKERECCLEHRLRNTNFYK